MKIQKRKRHLKLITAPPIVIKQDNYKWRWAAVVFAIATLLALCSCASAPLLPAEQEIVRLQEENRRLTSLLEECEADASACLDLLIECEGINE